MKLLLHTLHILLKKSPENYQLKMIIAALMTHLHGRAKIIKYISAYRYLLFEVCLYAVIKCKKIQFIDKTLK